MDLSNIHIIKELEAAKDDDYKNVYTADDLPHGHPCIDPEKFYAWLMNIIELSIRVCKKVGSRRSTHQHDLRMLTKIMDDVILHQKTVRMHDLLEDGIEEKYEELEAYRPDSNETNDYIETIKREVEEFKNLYFFLYNDQSEPENFDFEDINTKVGEIMPYDTINESITNIIQYLYQYLYTNIKL